MIWNKNQDKRKFTSREIRSSIKETKSLFQFIEKQLQYKDIITEELNEKELRFYTKIRRKRINVEIRDTERENFLEVNIYNPRKEFMNVFSNWSNKQLFGLKYGLWIVLLMVAISLIPLIILLAIQENITQETQTILRTSGFILVSIGGSVLFIYLLSIRLSMRKKGAIYEDIMKLSDEIIKLIKKFREDKANKKVCWNCYSEIIVETKKCPHCGIEL